MTQVENGETLPVMKPTRFMSNSQVLLQELSRKCRGCPKHGPLSGKHAKAAAIYPRGLCRAVCQGVRKQLELDRDDMMVVPLTATAQEISAVDVQKLWSDGALDGKQFWDDVSGKVLDASLTQAARMEEIKEAERMKVWVKTSREECIKMTGKGPIGTRWVDTKKGG